MHIVGPLLKDLRGLLAIQLALFLLTIATTTHDVGDIRVHLAWFVFLIPGWLLATAWTASRAEIAKQYSHAMIGSIAAHGCLAGIGFLCGLSFSAYYISFGLLLALSVGWRVHQLSRRSTPRRLDMAWPDLLVWIAVMFLVVAVFRAPRSNDILQFSLQQQDMAAERSMQPSSIGMEALGVDQPMARWRSHFWHLWPCLIAEATGLPVDGVLFRWAPIPLAFAVIASLMHFVGSLVGGRVPLWTVALAVLGPVVLWYRSYNAFNYSFRLTNNFVLDKDICLFFLVPAVAYLTVNWLRGARHYGWPILFLIPAILKFHPMTPVYLVLLVPFVVLGYQRSDRRSRYRPVIPDGKSLLVVTGAMGLFIAVMLIGDAQSSHQHVNQIINLDFADAREGRPLHYWVGHYAAVKDHGLQLDTTAWSGERLHLRARVLLNCGLLGVSHLALLVWLVFAVRCGRLNELRRVFAFTGVIVMLWSAWLVSSLFLTRFPHYLGGYERIHWFAYLPALVAVAASLSVATRKLNRAALICGNLAIAGLLTYSALTFASQRPTLLTNVRGLNSLLDFELPEQIARTKAYQADWADQHLDDTRPTYSNDRDRVLFLDTDGNDQYWLIKQGAFWSEPYAEAFALQLRGQDFLDDRRFYYALLDGIDIEEIGEWLRRKEITLIVDRRIGANVYFQSLRDNHRLEMRVVGNGVWRIEQR